MTKKQARYILGTTLWHNKIIPAAYGSEQGRAIVAVTVAAGRSDYATIHGNNTGRNTVTIPVPIWSPHRDNYILMEHEACILYLAFSFSYYNINNTFTIVFSMYR